MSDDREAGKGMGTRGWCSRATAVCVYIRAWERDGSGVERNVRRSGMFVKDFLGLAEVFGSHYIGNMNWEFLKGGNIKDELEGGEIRCKESSCDDIVTARMRSNQDLYNRQKGKEPPWGKI